MDPQKKKSHAVRFIEAVQQMSREELEALIQVEAGEDLSAFFAVYAGKVMADRGDQPGAAASTLMLLGYLIRATEENGESLLGAQGGFAEA